MNIFKNHSCEELIVGLSFAVPCLFLTSMSKPANADGSWQLDGYTASDIIQSVSSNSDSANCETFRPYVYCSSNFLDDSGEGEESATASAQYVANIAWHTTTGTTPAPLSVSVTLAVNGYTQPGEIGPATSSASSSTGGGDQNTFTAVTLSGSGASYNPTEPIGPVLVQTTNTSFPIPFEEQADTSANVYAEDYPDPTAGAENTEGSSAAANATASVSASTGASSA